MSNVFIIVLKSEGIKFHLLNTPLFLGSYFQCCFVFCDFIVLFFSRSLCSGCTFGGQVSLHVLGIDKSRLSSLTPTLEQRSASRATEFSKEYMT